MSRRSLRDLRIDIREMKREFLEDLAVKVCHDILALQVAVLYTFLLEEFPSRCSFLEPKMLQLRNQNENNPS